VVFFEMLSTDQLKVAMLSEKKPYARKFELVAFHMGSCESPYKGNFGVQTLGNPNEVSPLRAKSMQHD